MGVILAISIFLGILQSILFWEKDPGISVFIFIIACMAYLIYILDKNKKIVNKKALIFLIPIILLSSTYFIFNNALFQTLNFIVIFLLTIIMCIYLCKPKMVLPKFLYYIVSTVMGALESVDDVIKCFKIPEEKRNNEKFEKIKKIGKSILISLPIIIVVLLLLMSADEIFKEMFNSIFSIFDGITTIPGMFTFIIRLVVIAIVSLLIAGFLTNLVKENTMFTEESKDYEETKGIKVEKTTINIILTILNIIYLMFSTIQFTNLFSHIGNIQGFDYATYARQGFFQLMFVSFINFAILFVINMNKEIKAKKYTKFMSLLMILFTVVIIVSAFYRMNLYQEVYGYTYLRIFVYFALITELILVVPIIIYILGKNIDILKTSIIIVSAMYVILNFINIDKTIASKNIDKYFEDPENSHFDLSYLIQNTGTDAISEIKKLEKSEDENIKERTKQYLQGYKYKLTQEEKDWQEWNLSKQKAMESLDDVKYEVANYK